MKIIINPKWLATCGLQKYEGQLWVVVRMHDHGSRGTFYEVVAPDGYNWTVWSARGVEEVE